MSASSRPVHAVRRRDAVERVPRVQRVELPAATSSSSNLANAPQRRGNGLGVHLDQSHLMPARIRAWTMPAPIVPPPMTAAYFTSRGLAGICWLDAFLAPCGGRTGASGFGRHRCPSARRAPSLGLEARGGPLVVAGADHVDQPQRRGIIAVRSSFSVLRRRWRGCDCAARPSLPAPRCSRTHCAARRR